MSNILRIVILLCGVSFTAIILYLLIVKKMNERNSVVWLIGSFTVLGLSAVPSLLDKIAVSIGVSYPPALLFLVSTLVLLFCILYYSIQISALQDKIKKLAQENAVNNLIQQKKFEELEQKLEMEKGVKKDDPSEIPAGKQEEQHRG